MQSLRSIRIGVLGCAQVARQHIIPSLLELSDKFQLVAVASRSAEKAEEFSRIFGCKAVVGYNQLLNRSDIDAIYCPLPTGLHAEWIGKALREGKHVYTEKSLGMTFEETKMLVGIAKEKDLALMEGFMYKFHPQHQIVKDLINEGTIGDLRHFSASFGFPLLPDLNNFRYDEKIGGGVIMDAAAYTLSAIHFITGKKMKVKASNVFRNDRGTSIYGSALLVAGSELSADIRFGFDNFYQCRYEVWGTRGKITVPKAFTPKKDETTTILLETQQGEKEICCQPHNHFISSLSNFYDECCHLKRTDYDILLHQSFCLDEIRNQTLQK